MTVKELHIGVDLGVDNLNAKLQDWVEDEELDFILNKNQLNYIKTKYNPTSNKLVKGFEQSEKRIQDLSKLHIVNYSDTAYVTDDSNRFRFNLPQDLMFITSITAMVFYKNCGSITYSTTEETVSYFKFKLNTSSLLSFVDFDVLQSGVSILTSTSDFSNYLLPEDLQAFITLLKERNNSNYRITYETFYDIYEQGTLFFEWIGAGTIPATLTLKYDNTTSVNTNVATLDISYLLGTTGTRERFPVKVMQIDDLYVALKDSYSKPIFDRPFSHINENFIDIYTDDTFIIEKVLISYIRIPKRISLRLNQTSELAEHTHQEIVDLTVSFILELIQSQRYQTNLNELNKNE